MKNIQAILVLVSLALAACGTPTPPAAEELPSPIMNTTEIAVIGKGEQAEISSGDANMRVYYDGESTFSWTKYDPTAGWQPWKDVALEEGDMYIIPWAEEVLAYQSPPSGTAIIKMEVRQQCVLPFFEGICFLESPLNLVEVEWVP